MGRAIQSDRARISSFVPLGIWKKYLMGLSLSLSLSFVTSVVTKYVIGLCSMPD